MRDKIFRHDLKHFINNFEYELLGRKMKLVLNSDSNADKSGDYVS